MQATAAAPTRLDFIEPTDVRERAIVVPEQGGAMLPAAPLPAPGTPAHLLAVAVQRGASIEELRELMALEREWRADQAQQSYNEAFAAFKTEAIEILKRKRVHFKNDSGKVTDYKHAELSDVIEAVVPALSKYGLAHSWSLKQEKDWLWVTCTLKHKGGGSDSVMMGGPPDAKGGKNPVQALASTKTMLERQTLKAVCGVSEKGDDDDGRGGGNQEPDSEADALDEWRAVALKGDKALRAHYDTNRPTEAFWTKHGPSLRKAAKDADAEVQR